MQRSNERIIILRRAYDSGLRAPSVVTLVLFSLLFPGSFLQPCESRKWHKILEQQRISMIIFIIKNHQYRFRGCSPTTHRRTLGPLPREHGSTQRGIVRVSSSSSAFTVPIVPQLSFILFFFFSCSPKVQRRAPKGTGKGPGIAIHIN